MKRKLRSVVLNLRLIRDHEICIDSLRIFMIVIKSNKTFNHENYKVFEKKNQLINIIKKFLLTQLSL